MSMAVVCDRRAATDSRWNGNISVAGEFVSEENILSGGGGTLLLIESVDN